VVYEFPGCLSTDVPIIPQYKEKDVSPNTCYDATDIGIASKQFLSAEGYPLDRLADNVICETKVYFLDNCAGEASSTDNYNPGKCVNALFSSANKVLESTVGKSIRVECCIGAADKKSCAYMKPGGLI
jgi:hypothetical protein